MSVAVKMRHIESSPTVARPGVILRFVRKPLPRIIRRVEREYADYLIDEDD